MTTAYNVEKFIRENYSNIGLLKGVKMICEVWKHVDEGGIVGSQVVIDILGEKLADRFFRVSTTRIDHLELGLGQIEGAHRWRQICARLEE